MKRLFVCLTLLSSLLLPSCSSQGMVEIDASSCPSYSNEKKFSFYAYTPPGNGYYTVDGYDYPGKIADDGTVVSFQTKEKYQEYKDCGFDTILLQADDAYCGEAWETSHMKSLMDIASEVGLKSIIFDNRLYTLSNKTSDIVGEGASFSNQSELESYVSNCMSEYRLHPSFHGLLIKDEPSYQNLPAIGSLYRAIKTVSPETFVQCNLFPLSQGSYAYYSPTATKGTVLTAYKQYLEQFLEETGADYIMADSYPMKMQNGYNQLDVNHIKTVQMLNEAASKSNAKVYMVAQTSAWKNNGIVKARACEEADMRWQTNLYMGMGVKQISYFTYQTKKTNSTGGEYFQDGASFLKWNGQKTPLYDIMKGIHVEMEEFAPVVLSFDYVGLKYYKEGTPDISFLSGVNFLDSLSSVCNVNVSNNSLLLVSEMKDPSNQRKMYMFMNPSDPSLVTSTEKITFQVENENAIAIYSKGKLQGYRLDGKPAELSLSPGEAAFVMPFSL